MSAASSFLPCNRYGCLAVILSAAVRCQAGADTSLAFLADSAGSFAPPFSAEVTSYSQTIALPELLLWPHARDVEATVEVRAGGGLWQRVANGRTLSLGGSHAAVVRADGGVAAWGSNDYGQCNVPAGLTNVVSVACGLRFTLALRADGTVAAWGSEDSHQVSGPAGLTGVAAISASHGASYAVMNDGSVRSWGESPLPSGVTNITRLESYSGKVRALRRDGTWLAWDWDGLKPALLPPGFSNAVALNVEGVRYISLQSDGTVREYTNTQFGTPSAPPPAGLHGVIAVAAGEADYVALKSDGSVTAWGSGPAAVVPSGLSGAVAVDAAGRYSAALRADGSVVTWGEVPPAVAAVPENLNGSPLRAAAVQSLTLGANTVEVRLTPPGGAPAKTYALDINRLPNAGLRVLEAERGQLTPAFHSSISAYTLSLPFANDSIRLRAMTLEPAAALQINGQAITSGALTDPLPLTPGSNVITCRVVAGDGVTERMITVTVTRQPPQGNAALRHLAHMAGPLAPAFAPDQLSYTHSTPVRRPELVMWPRVAQISARLEVRANSRPWQEVSTGRQTALPEGFGLVLTPEKQVRAWNPLNVSETVFLPRGMPVCAAVGEAVSYGSAIRSDGVPLVWRFYGNQPAAPPGLTGFVETAGNDSVMLGLRGDGTVAVWEPDDASPRAAFSGLTDVVSVAGGPAHFSAVRRNGTVVLWSDSGATPTSVPAGLTDVVDAAPGQFFTVALKRDGTVVTWGTSGSGVLNTPAGLRDVVDVAATGGAALALRADGTVVAWGNTISPPDYFSSLTGISQITGTGSGFMLWQRGTGPAWTPPAQTPPGMMARDLPSAPAVPLDIGANSVQIRVTAEDGTNRTYTVAVTREPNADLRALELDFSALSPAFSPALSSYDVQVPGTRTSLSLRPATDDPTAAVRINGTLVPPGSAHTVALNPGLNTLSLTVTAEDGVTTRTITLRITRELPNTNLRSLSTGAGLLPALPGTRAQTYRQPAITVWPRQAAAGAVLECRTSDGPWQRMAAGDLIAGGVQQRWVAAVRPDGTVSLPGGIYNPGFSVPEGLSGVVSVAAGSRHCAALKSDGTVTAFGDYNLQGEWNVPPGLINACALTAAGAFTIALRTDGTLTGWGENAAGQLNFPAGLNGVVAVEAWSDVPSTAWCLALRDDGTVIAWGRGLPGPLTAPPQIQGAVDTAITGSLTACALLHTGHVINWNTEAGTAGVIPQLTGIAAITGSLALRTDGSVLNIDGTELSPPVTGGVAAIHGGFAVRADGTVFKAAGFSPGEAAWTTVPEPSHLHLSLAQGSTATELRLRDLGVEAVQTLTITRTADTALRFLAAGGGTLSPPFARGLTQFSQAVRQPHYPVWALPVNAAATVEVRANGGAWTRLATGPAFSANSSFLGVTAAGGITGSTTGGGSLVTGTRAVSAAEHTSHSLILLADGLPLGRSNYYPAYPSLRLPFFSERFSLLAAGDKHALALRHDGTLATWGETNSNQANFPGSPLSNVVQVSAGRDHSLALLADGTVRAAGANNFGQGTVPPGLTGVVAVAAGFNHNLALRHDGTVTAWGDNSGGQTDVPPRAKEVIAVSAGFAHSMALTRSGAVYAWGDGGVSDLTGSSQLSGAVAIAAGSNRSLMLRPDGSLAAWGTGGITVPSGFRAAALPPAAALPLATGENTVEVRVTEPDGSASAVTTIDVTRLPSADLTSLQLQSGDLSPAFAPGTTEYSASVPFSTAVLHLQAQALENGAAIRVNGASAAGGHAALPLLPGDNIIAIEVTAEDGITRRNWTLTVTRRAGSAQSALRFLTASTGPLSPVFDPVTRNYTQPAVNLPPQLLHALPNDSRQAVQVKLNSVPLQPLHTGCRLTGGDRFILAVKADDTVAAWGINGDGQTSVPPGLTNVTSVTAGTAHSVALRRDGSVIAWGRNAEGQCDVPAGLGSVVAIAAGGFKTMALRADGTVAVWGTKYLGQSSVPAGLTNVTAIAAGYTHCLALRRNGSIVTWGEPFPPPFDPGTVIAVSAGTKNSTVLRRDGTVLSWGTGGISYSTVPFPIAALDTSGASAIRADGTLATGGLSGFGTNVPAELAGVSAVWGNKTDGCALLDDGTFVSWGNAIYAPPAGLAGKSGRSFAAFDLRTGANVIEFSVPAEDGLTTADYRIAVTRNPNTALTALTLAGAVLTPAFASAVTEYTAAVPAATGSVTLAASLEDSTSLLEVNGAITPAGQPVTIPLAHGANEITVRVTAEDGVTTLLRRIAVTRAFWSSNASLRSLGSSQSIPMAVFMPAQTSYSVPGPAAFLTLWPRSADAGAGLEFQVNGGAWAPLNRTGAPVFTGNSNFAIALQQNGIPLAWGRNSTGQRDIPAGLSNVVSVAAGIGFSLALRNDGGVVAWGENQFGQATVPAGLTAAAIAAGRYHELAIRTGGTVAAWGQNSEGQCNVPVTLTDVTAVAGGYTHSLALTRDGRVVSWGFMAQSTVPAALPPVVAIAAGDEFSAALKQDGTVAAWGANTSGQTTVPAGLTGVTGIACGGRHVLALKQDGTVAAWGDNASGQRTLPAGLNDVVAVAAGGSLSLALRSNGTVAVWGTNSYGQTAVPAGLVCPPARDHVHTAIRPGLNTIALRLTAADGVTGQTYTVTARGSVLPLYQQWSLTAFPGGSPAAMTDATADPDNDGLRNGLEYLFNSDPLAAGASPLMVHEEEAEFTVTFPRRTGVPEGFETVEHSSSPETGWGSAPAAAISRAAGGPGQPDTVTVRLPRTGSREFVRLRVTF